MGRLKIWEILPFATLLLCGRALGACPTGWLPFGEYCYLFETQEQLSWNQAAGRCAKDNSYLATIENQEVSDFVNSHMGADETMFDYWIGLFKKDIGYPFEWMERKPVNYTNWADGEPNDNNGQETCVEVYKGGGLIAQWNDHACTTTLAYVCRKLEGEPPVEEPDQGSCPDAVSGTWEEYNDYCYMFPTRTFTSYYTALVECRTNHGLPASIHSIDEEQHIRGKLGVGSNYWIGLTRKDTTKALLWVDGTKMDFSYWKDTDNEPSDSAKKDCVQGESGDGRWQTVQCNTPSRVVCKAKKQEPGQTPGNCPNSHWTVKNGAYCYIFQVDIPYSFDQAVGKCTQYGGNLASIENEAENTFITQSMNDQWDDGFDPDPFWIAHYKPKHVVGDVQPTDYIWYDGSDSTYMNWAPEEPNDYNQQEHCVQVRPDGSWNDDMCTKTYPFVCKAPLVPRQPPSDVTGSCPSSDWKDYGYTCYLARPDDTVNSYFDAEARCQSERGQLASIYDLATSEYIMEQMGGLNDYWIGLKKTMDYFPFSWPSTDRIVDYTNWLPDEPWDSYGFECTEVHKETGLWENVQCGAWNNAYICEAAKGEYPPAEDGVCPGPEWEDGGNACYKFEGNGYETWDGAQKLCQEEGGYLTSIVDAQENDYILGRMNDLSSYLPSYHIGLSKPNKDSQFTWFDNTPYDENHGFWAPGEPNDQDGTELCVEVYGEYYWDIQGMWNDHLCGEAKPYVCKAPKRTLDAWTKREGTTKEYYVGHKAMETSADWHYARWFCNENGGDLSSIADSDEKDFITAEMSKNGQATAQYWIGLSKLDRGSFQWADGSGNPQNFWGPSQPDETEVGNTYLCAYSGNQINGEWYNANCGEKRGFVCKREEGNTGPNHPEATLPTPGFCPAGWVGISGWNKCYKFEFRTSDTGVSWMDAQARCEQATNQWSSLASIHSLKETAIILSQLQNITWGLWIGLYRDSETEDWKWVDNERRQYDNWGPAEPSGGSDNCAEVWMIPGPAGTWNNIPCDTAKRGYICETYKDADNPINTSPATTPHSCGFGWTPYWNSCYKIDTLPRNWQDSETNCVNLGGNLVSTVEAAENAAMAIFGSNIEGHFWIGMKKDPTTMKWEWSDGWFPFFTNWAPDQPNNTFSCASSGADGLWSSMDCVATSLPSICKQSSVIPITPPDHIDGICPEGDNWDAHGSFCYYYSSEWDEQVEWIEALKRCGAQGASLVSIHSEQENEYLYTQLKNRQADTEVWTGLYTSEGVTKWTWVDLASVQYSRWAPWEPSGEDSYCAVLMVDEHQTWQRYWGSRTCGTAHHFVCKKIKSNPTTLPPAVEGLCPGDEWDDYGSKCFYYEPDLASTWDAAKARCEQKGGQLAKIRNGHENNHVYAQMLDTTNLPNGYLNDFWIGLSKQDRFSQYLWLDNTAPDYTNWAFDEPNDDTGTENCVEIYGGPYSATEWNDHRCDDLKGYVCEAEKSGTNPGGSGLSGGQVAGIVIGVLLGVAVLAVVAFVGLTYYRTGAMPSMPSSMPSFPSFSNANYSGGDTNVQYGDMNKDSAA